MGGCGSAEGVFLSWGVRCAVGYGVGGGERTVVEVVLADGGILMVGSWVVGMGVGAERRGQKEKEEREKEEE